MRLLIDENISPLIGAALKSAGHDVLAAVSVCKGEPDLHVVAIAISQCRILISEDKDFGELAFRDGISPPGIIRLMLPAYRPLQKAERLIEVLNSDANSISGALVVIEPGRVRTRALEHFSI